MQALDLLLKRQSCPRLEAPAPTADQLAQILAAGMRVPDHGGLTPWQFIVAQDAGLTRLGDIFAAAASAAGGDEANITRAAQLPLRAPMVITVAAKVQPHTKVPALEQQIAAGCAVMAMQQAAFALGLGSIWRTGTYAFDRSVHEALELGGEDQIVGFLYVGTPVVKAPEKAAKSSDAVTRYL
ncbi:nitroreductase [Shewanella sp. NFH-SH190041]|uniref:NAD(P)H nitroreductase n=1 Tax=Shewanella sp. NFH-SH190041 TaxID=2950245 RepID=UPI0021C4637C|nr:NAD(P)H nitroreductase [Shewanella sp. NFH-SH190041]BDM64756.1 nitroreductase [Shewanella sp. NFH-SH190041]